MTFIPIVDGAFGTVSKGLLKGLENLEIGGRVETIQSTVLLRTARILRRVLETCCYSNSNERPSANVDVKTQGVNNKTKQRLFLTILNTNNWHTVIYSNGEAPV